MGHLTQMKIVQSDDFLMSHRFGRFTPQDDYVMAMEYRGKFGWNGTGKQRQSFSASTAQQKIEISNRTK
jgi:hypothetical protein